MRTELRWGLLLVVTAALWMVGSARADARERLENLNLSPTEIRCLSEGAWCYPGDRERPVASQPVSRLGLPEPAPLRTADRARVAAELSPPVPTPAELEPVVLPKHAVLCYSDDQWCELMPGSGAGNEL